MLNFLLFVTAEIFVGEEVSETRRLLVNAESLIPMYCKSGKFSGKIFSELSD